MVHCHMYCRIENVLDSDHHPTTDQNDHYRNCKEKKSLIFNKLGYKRSKRKATKLHPKDTYSPAPIDKLSTLPLMKYKFSPVQWNTLKLGLNLYKSDSPVP